MSTLISYNIDPNLNIQPLKIHKTYYPVQGWKLTTKEQKEQNLSECLTVDHFYLENDRFAFKYPSEFHTPTQGQDRYIIFQYCYCVVNKHTASNYTVHASFVPRNNYCDSLVYVANLQVPDDNRKYLIDSNVKQGFMVWFKDTETRKIIVPDYFILFLKIEY